MAELEAIDLGCDEADAEDSLLDCDQDDFDDLLFFEDFSALADLKSFDDFASLDDLVFFQGASKDLPAFDDGRDELSANTNWQATAEAAKQHTKINPLIFISNPVIVMFKTRHLTSS
ncbi:MAG: hypothetical protein V4660_01775 [Pseudomonadota bacterium]